MFYESGFGEVFLGRWIASKTVMQYRWCKLCAVVPKAEFCLWHWRACDRLNLRENVAKQLGNITKWLLFWQFPLPWWESKTDHKRNPRHTSMAIMQGLGFLTSLSWTICLKPLSQSHWDFDFRSKFSLLHQLIFAYVYGIHRFVMFVCGYECTCVETRDWVQVSSFILLHLNIWDFRVSHWGWYSSAWLSCVASELQRPACLQSSSFLFREASVDWACYQDVRDAGWGPHAHATDSLLTGHIPDPMINS